ncbi:PP2C family serine/threonine-protein phosphatase [Stenotrophomonas sp. 24(2023)]|uniref:PP2C family serine/threonine-protein phosphatase n=1 Tax=Stenotrophomonas sp. 24(2023) TaxID=3068324 RepID=UPI0027E01756|nr:PP2C family serine/threonine-protein phosphatase [Stenotrophomonas sp. 24(2023)]WMJ68361.1 PP2C family serine/threonine-protein phosphatase [Stenotrophomonas sp. 24(2023)]
MAASATGRSHLDRGQPCQDAFASACTGSVLVAVVCDGAGSASHSEVGARAVSAQVVAAMAQVLASPSAALHGPVEVLRGHVVAAISTARDALAEDASGQGTSLADHACTLVGVVADARGGWFFHIGDGVAACMFADGQPEAVSLPANGEYANETWFVTGEGWREQLRLTRFDGAVQAVVLMSDGVQPFAMARSGTALYPPFITPVLRYLDGVEVAHGSQALQATLADPRTDAITGDDKTLLVALPG